MGTAFYLRRLVPTAWWVRLCTLRSSKAIEGRGVKFVKQTCSWPRYPAPVNSSQSIEKRAPAFARILDARVRRGVEFLC